MADPPNTDPACLVPADEAILEVLPESRCPTCRGTGRVVERQSWMLPGEGWAIPCRICDGTGREKPPDDPEASDLLDSVSPGESAALVQEVEARTDFREAAKVESERCAKMARDLAEFGERLGRHLACVQRQHAKYASRAELLRRYLSDDPTSSEVPL